MKELEEVIKDIGLDKLPSEYTLEDFKPMHQMYSETKAQLERLKKSSAELVLELEKENAELKARLAKAIEPKFKAGQKVWIFVNKNNYECFDIEDISIRYWVDGGYEYLLEEDIYTTKEEAEKRLKELSGEIQ